MGYPERLINHSPEVFATRELGPAVDIQAGAEGGSNFGEELVVNFGMSGQIEKHPTHEC